MPGTIERVKVYSTTTINEKLLKDDAELLKSKIAESRSDISRENLILESYNLLEKDIYEYLETDITNIFKKDDAFVIFTKEPQYYLRFGALLNYIKNYIIIKINNKNTEPIFDIDTKLETQKMYSLPNRISLDPRVCIVRNSKIDIGSFSSPTPQNNGFMLRKDSYEPSIGLGGNYKSLSQVGAALAESTQNIIFKSGDKTANAFNILQPFTDEDNGGTNKNSAYILNIYLNFDFILESLSADDKGNISVYNLLSKICTGLNKALGGINNLEPIIDESSNTLQIIDTTPIPKPPTLPGYTLQIYGYDKIDSTNKGYLGNNYISNFVRKVDLKTAITPEFATMITVGATAEGYVKGVEATAFSKWNTGLTDRFKKDLLPPKGKKSSLDDDEATSNYENAFKDHTRRYGIASELGGLESNESITNSNFSNNLINKNISVMTEYYKYLVATSTRGKATSGGTVGFIPFKLNLTMDGLSGIKIYNVLHVDTKFLPRAYGRTVDLIVTGISHKLSNNDWETTIESTVMPKTSSPFGNVSKSPTRINTTVTSLQSVEDSPLGLNPPSTGWEILHPKYPNNTQQGKNIDIIINTFKNKGVTNPYAIVGALSVIGKESLWIPQSENLNYSKERLPEVWGAFSKTGKRVKDGEGKSQYNTLAAEYARDSVKLANFVYGSTTSNPKGMRSKEDALGNLEWGDGHKYRGRGFNQITWKANYETYSKEFGVDLVKSPDKLNEPELAAKVAFSFFFRVFQAGRKSNPIDFMNSFTSIDEALVYFAKANSGSIKNTATYAITKSREKRKYFNIVKN